MMVLWARQSYPCAPLVSSLEVSKALHLPKSASTLCNNYRLSHHGHYLLLNTLSNGVDCGTKHALHLFFV